MLILFLTLSAVLVINH